jgi:branched-chain amino acid transport system ATP-binding protein
MDSPIILETHDLRKEFGGLVAVAGVNIQIHAQTLHSIIGPNGAGKTTFFNLVSGNLKPTHGRVLYKSRDITDLPAYRRAHMGIGRSFQITNLFPNLTVFENIRLAAQAIGKDSFRFWQSSASFRKYQQQAEAVIAEVGLEDQIYVLARNLSHGNQRKLEMAILLASDPETLLLDEPTAGMAREEIPLLMEVIERIRQQRAKTILLVEHKMDLVMNVSDRITVMHNGQILAEGTPSEIAANKTVQSAYLGDLYGDFSEVR